LAPGRFRASKPTIKANLKKRTQPEAGRVRVKKQSRFVIGDLNGFGFEKTNPITKRGRDGEGLDAAILRFEANLVQETGMILLLSSRW
jgi:hypothetical protein